MLDIANRLGVPEPALRTVDGRCHGVLQAQETAEPQEYARPRRGLLASLTATWSDLSSDDEASSSGRRSGASTGAAARQCFNSESSGYNNSRGGVAPRGCQA